MSLAITEPGYGSDVANIETTARREGDYYIVNGEKKFITAGGKADYFTTAVRTGGPGMTGISLLLIERNTPGFTIRRLKTQGAWSSSTTLLVFDNVKVPVKNLIGKENQGFRLVQI
jgi:acyl-CoA dehydrogenase